MECCLRLQLIGRLWGGMKNELPQKRLRGRLVHGPREKIYACFADFKRAFDSFWHEEFLHKLLQIGVGGCFYKLIQNLYSDSSCTLKIGRSQTRSFHYLRGVRQGCILSPLLIKLIIY